MSLKGFDQLRKHVPELNTPIGILRLFSAPVLQYFFFTTYLPLKTFFRLSGFCPARFFIGVDLVTLNDS